MNEENYTDKFCLSCKHRYQKEKHGKEYCKLTGEWIFTSQDRCEKWEK